MICQVVPCNIPLNLHKTVVQYRIWLYTAKNVRSNTAGFSIRVRHPRFFGKKKMTQKSQNYLVMSVFCSNTLIFVPEFWKCNLRGPDCKMIPAPVSS